MSNFWPAKVFYENLGYPSVENAYQAAKTDNEAFRIPFASPGACTSGEAKRLGRKLKVRPDWDEIKIDVMYNLNLQKFQGPVLKKMLLDTGDAVIEEGNTWGDQFWGVDLETGLGENNLGNILMLIRDELKEKAKEEEANA